LFSFSKSINTETITYPGTRAWLEDESLSIRITKTLFGCIPITIAKKALELQGVLDYGYISTVIEMDENVNSWNWIWNWICWKQFIKSSFKING
jgi:hypothetical protein